MKIGDIIARKDMPTLPVKIVGESNEWGGIWYIKILTRLPREDYNRNRSKQGFITKDDNRWEVVKK